MDDLLHGLTSMGQGTHTRGHPDGTATALQGAAFGATFDALSPDDPVGQTISIGPDGDTFVTVAGSGAEGRTGSFGPLTSPTHEVDWDNVPPVPQPPSDGPAAQAPAPPSATNVAINAQFAEQGSVAFDTAPIPPLPGGAPPAALIADPDQPPGPPVPPPSDASRWGAKEGGPGVMPVGESPSAVSGPPGLGQGRNGPPPSHDPEGRSPSSTGRGGAEDGAPMPPASATGATLPRTDRSLPRTIPSDDRAGPRTPAATAPASDRSGPQPAPRTGPPATPQGLRASPGIGAPPPSEERVSARVQPLAINTAVPTRQPEPPLVLPTAPAVGRTDNELLSQSGTPPIVADRAAVPQSWSPATGQVSPPPVTPSVHPRDGGTGQPGGATATPQPRATQAVLPGTGAGAPANTAPPHPLAAVASRTGPAAPAPAPVPVPVPVPPTPQAAAVDAPPDAAPTTGPDPATASREDTPARTAQPLRTGGWTMAPAWSPAWSPASVLPAPWSFPLHPVTPMSEIVTAPVADPLTDLDFVLHAQSHPLSTTALTSSAVAAHHPPSATAQGVAQQISAVLSNPASDTEAPIELALDPPELGRVRLQLTEVAGAMTLMIHAERPETADLMRRHLELLSQEFAQAGLDAPTVHIRQDGQQAGANPGDGHRRDGAADGHTAPPTEPGSEGTRPLPQRTATGGLDLRL